MNKIMGIIQTIFGFIWIGFVTLFLIICIGVIVVRDTIDWFIKINNEVNETIKEYYRGLEERRINE